MVTPVSTLSKFLSAWLPVPKAVICTNFCLRFSALIGYSGVAPLSRVWAGKVGTETMVQKHTFNDGMNLMVMPASILIPFTQDISVVKVLGEQHPPIEFGRLLEDGIVRLIGVNGDADFELMEPYH